MLPDVIHAVNTSEGGNAYLVPENHEGSPGRF